MTPQQSSPANQPEYVEEPAIYLFAVALTSGQHISDVAVNIDRDSDFLWTGLNGSSTGNYTLNIRLPSGRQLANAEILDLDIIGTANQPTVIGPPPIYRRQRRTPAHFDGRKRRRQHRRHPVHRHPPHPHDLKIFETERP